MFCPSCGKQISDGDAFCRYCGHGISAASTAQPEVEQVSEQAAASSEELRHASLRELSEAGVQRSGPKPTRKGLILGIVAVGVVLLFIYLPNSARGSRFRNAIEKVELRNVKNSHDYSK